MKTIFCIATACLLSIFPGHMMANAAKCPSAVAETIDLFDTWWTYVEEKIDYDPRAALQDLKTEADRLGRALGGLDAANRLIARYADVLGKIDNARGPEAVSRASDNIFNQISWAGSSLTALSACLALVPVDVSHRNQITVAGAAVVMRYVQPEIFRSMGMIDRELRADGTLSDEKGRMLFQSLRTVNMFVDTSGGSFTECENTMRGAQVRGARIRIPSHAKGLEGATTVTFDNATATMTLGDARAACGKE